MFPILLTLFLTITQSKILDLTKSNFDSYIKSSEYVLIEFITKEQCPYCDELNREFTQLSMFVKIPFGTVDCNNQTELCEKQKIEVLPIIVLYRNGEEYRTLYGMHDYGEIKQWMNDMMLPTYVQIEKEEEMHQYESTNYGVALMRFPDEETEKQYHEMFNELANKWKRFKQQYLYIIDKKYEVPSVKLITMNKENDKFESVFDITNDKKQMQEKLILGSIPPMSVDDEAAKLLEYVPDIPIMHYIYDTRMLKATMLQRLAQNYIYTLPFVVERVNPSQAAFGHDGKNYPALTITKDKRTYPMDKSMKITEENVIRFIESVFNGSAKSIKKERKTSDEFMNNEPPIVTSDIYEQYTSGDSLLIACPFSNLKCGEYVNTIFKVFSTHFKDMKEMKIGAIDTEEDDILVDRIITSDPIIILTKEFEENDELRLKLFKPESFDPIEIINELNKFCKHKIDMTDEDVAHLRDLIHKETSVYHANIHLNQQKEEL